MTLHACLPASGTVGQRRSSGVPSRPGQLLAALPLVLVLMAPLAAQAQQDVPSGSSGGAALGDTLRTIEVTGLGEASAKPDRATATFTVLRTGETARAALDAANKAMSAVAAGMREAGAADRDLQTSGFSIAPQYRYQQNQNDGTQEPPTIVGYEVRNTLTVNIRDIAKVGEVLDRAVTLGVNQGGDISFDIADPKATLEAARRAAIADARATADLYAGAAGVTLGAVRSIGESSDLTPLPVPMPRSMKLMAADSGGNVPVEAGETSFRARVRMVFDIGS